MPSRAPSGLGSAPMAPDPACGDQQGRGPPDSSRDPLLPARYFCTGSAKRKEEPLPGLLSTQIAPPWASTT